MGGREAGENRGLVMSSSLSEPSLRTSPVPTTSHLFKTGRFPALENHPYTPDRRSNRKNRGVFTLCSHGLLHPVVYRNQRLS